MITSYAGVTHFPRVIQLSRTKRRKNWNQISRTKEETILRTTKLNKFFKVRKKIHHNFHVPANIRCEYIQIAVGFDVWRINGCISAIDQAAHWQTAVCSIQPGFGCSSFIPFSNRSQFFHITNAWVYFK